MAFSAISASLVRAGKELKYTLLDLVRTNFNDHEARILALEAEDISLPVGIVIKRGGSTVPTGWLECDGSAISRTDYAALFAKAGTKYGSGDGSTTFNIPDSRGRIAIGSGAGSGLTARTIGDSVGEETHALSEAELPSHTHTVNDTGHTHTPDPTRTAPSGASAGVYRMKNGIDSLSAAGTNYTNSAPSAVTFQNTGGTSGHNNVQPSLVCRFIIKAS